MQMADPAPPGWEASRQLFDGANAAPPVVAKILNLMLDGDVESKPAAPPKQKNRLGTTTNPCKSAMRSINFRQNGVKGKNAKSGLTLTYHVYL